jgi:hypothetical protein
MKLRFQEDYLGQEKRENHQLLIISAETTMEAEFLREKILSQIPDRDCTPLIAFLFNKDRNELELCLDEPIRILEEEDL